MIAEDTLLNSETTLYQMVIGHTVEVEESSMFCSYKGACNKTNRCMCKRLNHGCTPGRCKCKHSK